MPISETYNEDCMVGMGRYPDKFFDLAIVDDLQAGKAGEYLVCADLILKGFVAYPSEQGLPYDVVMDYNGRLLKVQVKATRGLRNVPQRKIPVNAYIFNIKRRGKNNRNRHTELTCDLYALVALDTREIGYLPNKEVRETMNFRCNDFRGKYLTDMTLEKCLSQL